MNSQLDDYLKRHAWSMKTTAEKIKFHDDVVKLVGKPDEPPPPADDHPLARLVRVDGHVALTAEQKARAYDAIVAFVRQHGVPKVYQQRDFRRDAQMYDAGRARALAQLGAAPDDFPDPMETMTDD